MKISFAVALLAVLAFSFPALAAPAKSANSPAGQFVQRLGDTALLSLTKKDLPRKTRESRVREILRANFDVPIIGRFAMGTYWRQASESQRQEYLSLFEDMIVQTYTTRFEDYAGQTLKVEGSSAIDADDYIVKSQVIQKDGPPVGLEWRVHDKGGALKIVDVIVEGVSMSVTQRSDFSATIQSGGGKVEALLASLRERKKQAAQKT